MSENDKDLEKEMPEGATCEDPCDCGQPEKPEQEYADAVDEAAEGEAEAAVDELQKWRDVAMRTAAEYDNYRKRCVKDREEFTRYATRGLLEELLPVVDNFEMGMMMAGQDTSSMIYIGMSMVQKQLNDFLTAQGVEPLWIRSLSRCLSLTTPHPSMFRWPFRLPICTTTSRPRTLLLHRCPPTFISRSGVSIAALSLCGALPSLRDTPLRECLRVPSPQPRFSHFR